MKFLRNIFSKQKLDKIVVTTSVIKKSITTNLAPELRKEGWKGSGFKFYRLRDNHIIELISFYGDRSGRKMYVEIGIHIDFIPLSVPCELTKMQTSRVDIRRRLTPNTDEIDWYFPHSENGLIQLNSDLHKAYATKGKQFFSLFNNWEDTFFEMTPIDIENYNGPIPFPTKGRTARILALAFNHMGNAEKAKEFAQYGLSTIIGPNGSALRPEFEAILNKT